MYMGLRQVAVAVDRCAMKNDGNKEITDDGKLLREAKDTINGLPTTLSQLLTMKREIQLTSDKAIKEIKNMHTAEVSFSRQKKPLINDKLKWLHCTWYTCPPNRVFIVSLRYFRFASMAYC